MAPRPPKLFPTIDTMRSRAYRWELVDGSLKGQIHIRMRVILRDESDSTRGLAMMPPTSLTTHVLESMIGP